MWDTSAPTSWRDGLIGQRVQHQCPLLQGEAEEYPVTASLEIVNGHMPHEDGGCARGLRKFDYVPTGEPIFGELVGPEIMYAWQFREAFAKTAGQAQECGLFSRAEALQEYKVKYQSHSVGVSTEPEVLTLSDLVPFFLI
ncbi:hypothetical protein HPB47_013880, partial [Ixodes persulcatus]